MVFRARRRDEAVRESVLEKGQVLERRLGDPAFKSWGDKRKPAKGTRKWPGTQEETWRHHTMVSRE